MRPPFATTVTMIAGFLLLAIHVPSPDPISARSPQVHGSSEAIPAQTPSLPDSIPLFPLPDIALLPGANMPLHVFEPRYREMVADALEGDRVIGMVMLRPGWEDDYEGNPPVYPVGGAGIIESVDELPDGRYDIVLRGTSKFRIEGENTDGAYRRARVEPVQETLSDEDRVRLSGRRDRLEEALRRNTPGLRVPTTLSDVVFVNTVAQYVSVEPADRQALLEAENALTRSELLMEILGMMRQAREPGIDYGRGGWEMQDAYRP